MPHPFQSREFLTKFWSEKSRGKTQFEWTRHEWRIIFEIYLREIGYDIVDWIYLAQDMD
jgi:hypothetical protein